jgi:hypothetical protein
MRSLSAPRGKEELGKKAQKTFGRQNVQVIDLAQGLAVAGDNMITVEMGPQSLESASPSQTYTVSP